MQTCLFEDLITVMQSPGAFRINDIPTLPGSKSQVMII